MSVFRVEEFISKISRSALVLRHEKFEDVSLQTFLGNQIKKGLLLRERRDFLNDYFI